MNNVAIVILNWNGKKHLETFLEKVVLYSGECRIVLADNASTDDSVKYVTENFPTVEIIINDENGGFSKGYNDALKAVESEYYILLNSDIEVTPNWVIPLFETMKDTSVAGCQPKVLSYLNKSVFEHAGASGGYLDKNYYPFCRGRIFEKFEEDKGQYNGETEIFWATGAALMIRSKLFHQVGGFDSYFFAHMEEIDLCWRLKNAGNQIVFVHNATVYHLGGGTLSSISPNKTYLNFRNNLYLLYKNLPDHYLHRTIFARMVLDGLAFFHFTFGGKFNHAWAILRAHTSFYKHLKHLRNSRDLNKQFHQLKLLKGVYNSSIVGDFYLKKVKVFNELNTEKFSQ